MTPESLDLFRAIVHADVHAVQHALAMGADVNATDGKGRNVVSHAALGEAIDAIDAPARPCLSERRLEVLQVILEHPDLSLYSLNAPLSWAGGVTLLGLMSWLNMPVEIMFLLEFSQGLVEVNAMDEQGATPLMYAARDGSLEVVQRLLAHGARPDLRDKNQRCTFQYALPHPRILWLCEDVVRRERANEVQPFSRTGRPPSTAETSCSEVTSVTSSQSNDLFFATSIEKGLTPPPQSHFSSVELHRVFDSLAHATRVGNVTSLREHLYTKYPDSLNTPLLINLRDGSGLSLVHHAVSQWRTLDVAVLDILFQAGADVGLFSALGFSPLHHLARTAKDPADFPISDQGATNPDVYAYTTHLLRDLRAPLNALDPKGETPLHAAAEHGRSRLVLQAMLDHDRVYSGGELVRELRNERGLRPMDVCRPEFIFLFEAQERVQAGTRIRYQDSWDSSVIQEKVRPPTNGTRGGLRGHGRPRTAGSSLINTRPRSAHGLLNKTSDGSLQSRSSASSASSGARSYHARPMRYSPQSRKPGTPLHAHFLLTPSPTGPSLLDVTDANSSIDVSAHTRDLLSNLSLCATALHAYSQGQQINYEMDHGDLPELAALSDTLLFTRDVASLVLEHWTTLLDVARSEFERARQQVDKAQALHDKVRGELNARLQSTRAPELTSQCTDTSSVSIEHATVQTEASAVYVAHIEIVARLHEEMALRTRRLSSYARIEDEKLKEPANPERAAAMLRLMQERRAEEQLLRDAEDEIRMNQWYVESLGRGEEIGASLLLGWVKRGSLSPLEIVREIESTDVLAVGRETRTQQAVAINQDLAQSHLISSFKDALQSVPRVIQRVEIDLSGIVSQLSQVTQTFIRAQQSVAEASSLIEQALQVREDKVQAFTRINNQHEPSSATSFSLPRVPLGSPSIEVSPAEFAHQFPPSPSSTSLHNRYIASEPPIEEPHALRRLLTRKIQHQMERAFEELQKAHVWLRIVREVLRGLRRRTSRADY